MSLQCKLKALADPIRAEILCMLKNRAECLREKFAIIFPLRTHLFPGI